MTERELQKFCTSEIQKAICAELHRSPLKRFRQAHITDSENELEVQMADLSWVTVSFQITPTKSDDLIHRWSC